MDYEVPPEIFSNTSLCRYNYACVSGFSVLPQCRPVCEVTEGLMHVKSKKYYLGECLYRFDIKDKNDVQVTCCVCPVRCELFKRYGK
jgi:hypothetical protein